MTGRVCQGAHCTVSLAKSKRTEFEFRFVKTRHDKPTTPPLPSPNPPKCPPSRPRSSNRVNVSSLLPQRRPPSTTRPRTTARLRRYATHTTADRQNPPKDRAERVGYDQGIHHCAHTKHSAIFALFSHSAHLRTHRKGIQSADKSLLFRSARTSALASLALPSSPVPS